jgi:hypothetical protein
MDRATDAFVIWIDGEAEAAASEAAFAGRIEHVQSAVRGTFATAHELLAFLTAHRRVQGGTPSEGER